MGLLDSLNSLGYAITAALTNAAVPYRGQVIIGNPLATEMVSVLAQPDREFMVSIFPILGARPGPRYRDEAVASNTPTPTIAATIAPHNVVTFTAVANGDVTAPINVHGIVHQYPDFDANFVVQGTVTPIGAAQAFGSAINQLSDAPFSATVVGNTVALGSGYTFEYVNVGTSGGSVTYEVDRIAREFEVSLWCPDPNVRTGEQETPAPYSPVIGGLYDAIRSAIGTVRNHFLPLADGTQMFCMYRTDVVDDTSQSSYSLYLSKLIFEVQYGVTQAELAAEIGAVELLLTTNTIAQPAIYYGGVNP